MRGLGAAAAVILASAVVTAEPLPDRMVGGGVSAGVDSPPGFAALAEVGAGFRRGTDRLWHVRVAWTLGSVGRWGGGSGTEIDARAFEARIGPTWWSCGSTACTGGSVEGGLQYIHIEEGGDESQDEAAERLAYAMSDFRFRVLAPSRGPLAIELSAAFRARLRLWGSRYMDGQSMSPEAAVIGAGVQFGIGLFAVF